MSGTIASQLHVHQDAVRRVLAQRGTPRPSRPRRSRFDACLPLVLDTLKRYARITATRVYETCRQRGYQGGPDHFRHIGFEPRPVAVARGNEKGRVERAIRYIRSSFMPARKWRDLEDRNAQAR